MKKDGFAIVQYNQEVTMRQGEHADLKILGANGSGLTLYIIDLQKQINELKTESN